MWQPLQNIGFSSSIPFSFRYASVSGHLLPSVFVEDGLPNAFSMRSLSRYCFGFVSATHVPHIYRTTGVVRAFSSSSVANSIRSICLETVVQIRPNCFGKRIPSIDTVPRSFPRPIDGDPISGKAWERVREECPEVADRFSYPRSQQHPHRSKRNTPPL